jgi:protein-L-isoaspartate(D-aspartate) O-methyltransferase
MGFEDRWANARDAMVDVQIARRGVKDERVLIAMRQVPREVFVGPNLKSLAYDDRPLPIGRNQTISQPYVVALMVEALSIKPNHRVLEIGGGSGYAAAIMSMIAAEIYVIERHVSLAKTAAERFKKLGFTNINIRAGDGSMGWPVAAPFDAILVSAGGPNVPETLKQQLSIGGRLVMPVGGEQHQVLVALMRTSQFEYFQHDLGTVKFVKPIGEQGWTE